MKIIQILGKWDLRYTVLVYMNNYTVAGLRKNVRCDAQLSSVFSLICWKMAQQHRDRGRATANVIGSALRVLSPHSPTSTSTIFTGSNDPLPMSPSPPPPLRRSPRNMTRRGPSTSQSSGMSPSLLRRSPSRNITRRVRSTSQSSGASPAEPRRSPRIQSMMHRDWIRKHDVARAQVEVSTIPE